MGPECSTSKTPSGSERPAPSTKAWRAVAVVIQWALVLYLLWPLRSSLHRMQDFVRVAGGIFLFVIFAGKLLYDQVVGPHSHSEPKEQILHTVGIIVGLVLVLGVVIFLVGVMLAQLFLASRSGS